MVCSQLVFEPSPFVGGGVYLTALEMSQSTWSRFKELRVKLDTGAPDSVTNESWNDTTFASLGATWKLDPQWALRCGLAVDSSAVDNNHRTPRIPDNDR